MAICKPCQDAADTNRVLHDTSEGGKIDQIDHPSDCGCPCLHMAAAEWDKYYLVPQPRVDSETDANSNA
jgi:hypothetical protein